MIAWAVGGAAIVLMLWVLLRLNRAVQASLAHEVPPEAESTDYPPISIIKPVYGADAHTTESFRSWAQQDYPAPLQLIFSFQRANDPALPLARAVNSSHECTVIVNPVVEGFNGKMSNLLHGVQAAHHGFLVFSDSDIRAEPDTCRRLATLHRQDMDLISCLMRHVGGRNAWGRVFAAFWNFEHMAFIAPAILKYGRDATGGTMAMTRATLEQIGGLAAFKDYVAEDVAMGRRAHDLGLRVGLGPIIDSPVDAMSLRTLLDKFARAALFGASMGNLGESALYTVLFSYWLVLLAGGLLGSTPS
jgi:ceramide glucosyltransferase